MWCSIVARRFDRGALKRKAVRSVETPGSVQPTRRHMPQDMNVQQDRCENPKSRICIHSFSCRICEKGEYYNNNNNNNNNNLNIEESFDTQHKNEEEKLKKECLRRLRLVLGTEFSAKNKIQAIGSLAVPELRYSFGIINWHQEELQRLDRKTRKLLTIHGQHHPKADVDRLYINNNNNNNNIYLLQLVCHPVAVVILHVYKI